MTSLIGITIDPEALKRARGARSLAEVARQIGKSRQHIWNYENGVLPPSDVLARLCELYGVEISQLTKKTLENSTT